MKGKKTLRISLMLVFTAAVLLVVQTRCRHSDLDASTLDKVCYTRDIAPILSGCSDPTKGCHTQNGGESGYVFTDYASVYKAVKTPFNAQKSPLYQAITGKGFKQLMPPSGPLSQANRILIRVWIDQGAVNDPTCVTTVGTVNSVGSTIADKVCFQRDLLPVLSTSCGITGCHDQASHKSGYIVTNYPTVMSNLVKAGSPATSRLYTVINGNTSSENFMPPKPYPALSAAVKDSIFNWIKNGALNDVCVSSCDTTGVITYQNQIATLISKNCISCHIGANASKGILLDTYANVKAYLDNGKLLAAVKGTTIQMPPGYKITTCELREIELWKANGAIQN